MEQHTEEKVFGCAPYGAGYFVTYNGKTYWGDGRVTSSPPLIVCAIATPHTNDYAAWTDEHRAAVLAATLEKEARAKQEMARHRAETEAIAESAKLKITDDELRALIEVYGS